MHALKRFLFHTLILAREELREILFRKRSVLSLSIYVAAVAFVGFALANAESSLAGTFSFLESEDNSSLAFLRKSGRDGLADYLLLLGEFPKPILLMQLLALVWYPTLVSLVSCDMVSLDLYRGSLRYLLTRTSREAYFAAKFLSHLLLYIFLAAVTWTTILLLCAIFAEGFSVSRYTGMSMRYFLVGITYLMFLVGSTQFVSSWSEKPMYAVTRLHMMWVAFFLLLLVPYLSPLDPWITAGLLAPMNGRQFLTLAGFMLWTGLFSAAGYLIFRSRQL